MPAHGRPRPRRRTRQACRGHHPGPGRSRSRPTGCSSTRRRGGRRRPAPAPKDPATEASRKEQEALTLQNTLEAERLKKETNALRSEITKLKMERELIGERNAMDDAKRDQAKREADVKFSEEKSRLMREAEMARIQSEKLANELKTVQTQAALDITRLQNDIAKFETEDKRAQYADSKPEYLAKPLRDNNVLVISDRRIPLNGLINSDTADHITERIDYWNNKDNKLPIFIVIDECPGGSVMAGYRILKSMQASKAPIHVVVKSFAASMAACITTLATESYAYPNAIILHHQISSTPGNRLNLTQQKEFFEENTRWWQRLATPVAQKMGISTDEFIKKMYAHSTSGDWSEFGDSAKELKWVNHIIGGVEETSLVKDPDAKPAAAPATRMALKEEVDQDGRPFVWLPRLNPKDCYFLYNADTYYRTR
ncbi:ATP-dependent Clp protease proteolytic subunit [Luteolibacter ambystomatis]|uniref:ATP-dependent Clp protease proteolytic subunit n=1 Tax=Luteolibacter ambystomatis TaxID=2824561 RepID=A0A975J2W3_9BACT|nr:ATP-dependent Clp protease proteolytic subunit [Luteolibacter ambystomatis]QUE53045.1 ATP-dependent Clp protease proteolytic subunit [Luteolibacter ambystomatis]